MRKQIIHHGDAGIRGLKCGAQPRGRCPADDGSNWVWKFEKVTCKRCIAITKKEIKDRE